MLILTLSRYLLFASVFITIRSVEAEAHDGKFTFGKLFTKNLRLYVYPLLNQALGILNTGRSEEIPAGMRALYQHLLERGKIKPLDNFDRAVLHIFSREVLKRIKDNSAPWEDMVPQEIADVIKQRRFFGYCEPKAVEEALAK